MIDVRSPGGFYTTDYSKPTAINRTFLNGQSYHPSSVFKSIIFSESIRLRRLNEKQENYSAAIERLRTKCLKSNFNRKLVRNMINITQSWTNRFSPSETKHRERKTVWASSFPDLLKLSAKEKTLNPKASITYKRPQTISQHLTKYKTIAHRSNSVEEGASKPCGRCSLCGNHGNSINMVNSTKEISTTKGKSFHLSKALTCADWGIYAATCTICNQIYVGQTSNPFSNRWSQHRSVWKGGSTDKGDSAALRLHYHQRHNGEKHRAITSAFTVTFIHQPEKMQHLDYAESVWINRLEANININKTILPRIM